MPRNRRTGSGRPSHGEPDEPQRGISGESCGIPEGYDTSVHVGRSFRPVEDIAAGLERMSA